MKNVLCASLFVIAFLASTVSLAKNTTLNATEDDLRSELYQATKENHHSVGYDEARRKIFGLIHLQQERNEYFVVDVYCGKSYSKTSYPDLDFGPNTYPKNGNTINTEHTWPQSRFTTRYPKDIQKADMHHLYPSDSKINSHRSSLQFGEVLEPVEKLSCDEAYVGHSANDGRIVFQPPPEHRGNIARALFYFATRYEMKISDQEEAFLRKWHKEDPVDEFEIYRNGEIEKIQGNRNPFIDSPDFVNRISNF